MNIDQDQGKGETAHVCDALDYNNLVIVFAPRRCSRLFMELGRRCELVILAHDE